MIIYQYCPFFFVYAMVVAVARIWGVLLSNSTSVDQESRPPETSGRQEN